MLMIFYLFYKSPQTNKNYIPSTSYWYTSGKFGVGMRAGILGLGLIIFILGLLMLIFFWPLIGYETQDTFSESDIESHSTLKYMGEVTEVREFAGFFQLELDFGTVFAYTNSDDFEINDNVMVTIVYGDNTTNWDENTYTVEKVPTSLGLTGVLFLIIGLVAMGVGAASKRPILEDLVTFSTKPPVQPLKMPETDEMPVHPISSPASFGDQVTCPKCGKVFGIHGLTPPIKIKCPQCGVEGLLN
jgi:hypothetical protein